MRYQGQTQADVAQEQNTTYFRSDGMRHRHDSHNKMSLSCFLVWRLAHCVSSNYIFKFSTAAAAAASVVFFAVFS